MSSSNPRQAEGLCKEVGNRVEHRAQKERILKPDHDPNRPGPVPAHSDSYQLPLQLNQNQAERSLCIKGKCLSAGHP
jgi:hypothetical protein